jgi:hypothetical protein
VADEAQADRWCRRFLEELAAVAAYARGSAHASTSGRQVGLPREQVNDLLLTLHASGLVEVDWMTRIVSLTRLGQRRVQRG